MKREQKYLVEISCCDFYRLRVTAESKVAAGDKATKQLLAAYGDTRPTATQITRVTCLGATEKPKFKRARDA